jgi:thymidylate synthase (FAD)
MNIVEPGFEILSPTTIVYTWDSVEEASDGFIDEAKLIERAGRTAYKSEDKITQDSYYAFIRGLIARGHEAVIEFGSMMVQFVTDRGVSHELVRHRLCSFVQESTRYCNYGQDKFCGEITVIRPSTWDSWTEAMRANWLYCCQKAEERYLTLVNNLGAAPQIARAVLPTCTKAEVCVRANFREWQHMFKLRAISRAAHPDMRALMSPLYEKCRLLLPCVFDMGAIEL